MGRPRCLRLHPELSAERARAWREAPEALVPPTGPGEDPRRHARVDDPAGGPPLFVKLRPAHVGPLAQLRPERFGALGRAFAMGRRLERAGIPAPAPLGLFTDGERTWLVSELLEGEDLARTLDARLRAGGTGAPDGDLPADLDEVLTLAGRVVGRLHAAGLRHRDLKAANLMVTPAGRGRAVELLDHEGVGRTDGTADVGVRARDLGRLYTSLADRERRGLSPTAWRRFFEAYADQQGLAAPVAAALEDWARHRGDAWRQRLERAGRAVD